MPIENKCSLKNMLNALLGPTNSEQNQNLPPIIYESFFNSTTSYLIDSLVDNYPTRQSLIDILNPFVESAKLQPKNGYIEFPENYRNFLNGNISVKKDFSSECNNDESDLNEKIFKEEIKKSGCLSRPLKIVDITEWSDLTTSSYKYPTYEYPIAAFFGKRRIKICPYDISTVELTYVRKERLYSMAYIIQPDDSYIIDEKNSIDSEWESNAFTYLFTGLQTLYGVYTRDKEFREWGIELKKIGLL